MLKIVLAGALVAAFATPATAHPLKISKALKAGCSVQQVNMSQGKIGGGTHTIVRCNRR